MTAKSVELAGIDGANPLGFLAALGTLVTIRQAGEKEARLRWTRGRTWTPVLDGLSSSDHAALSDALATALRGRVVSGEDERRRKAAQRKFDIARKAVQDKKKEIRKRGFSRTEREVAIEREVPPLEQVRVEKRGEWLDTLEKAVPRPELAIGKRIDCTYGEYREFAGDFRDVAGHANRETLDLLAAFGSDASLEKNSVTIAPTPFCFTKGSGQQYFLDTVRQLTERVTSDRVDQTLFAPWPYHDEGLSMRWDPTEERLYALMDRNPSESESRTVWMANLLAYRALVLFPCAPGRRGLTTTAWDLPGDKEPSFTWPIWEFSATAETILSVLQLRELAAQRPDRSTWRARGIAAVFRSRRIKVGAGSNYKLNFSPARAV